MLEDFIDAYPGDQIHSVNAENFQSRGMPWPTKDITKLTAAAVIALIAAVRVENDKAAMVFDRVFYVLDARPYEYTSARLVAFTSDGAGYIASLEAEG